MKFKARRKTLDLSSPVLMGVLNITPDSFSDGGRFLDAEAAVRRGLEMARQGAKIIDVGGESTRPKAVPVSAVEEKKRVIPVIKNLAAAFRKGSIHALISVDTYKPDVAQEALDAGADIVNDVTGFTNEKMRAVVGKACAGAVVMHMQGTPQSMQDNPVYSDVVAEVKSFLSSQAALVRLAGASGVLIDPGIGFGKTLEHNLELLARLDEFCDFGYPVCVGASRKSFIGKITGEPIAENRLDGTLAAVTACVLKGASVLRVHDVEPCSKAMQVAHALKLQISDSKVTKDRAVDTSVIPKLEIDEIRVQGIVLKCRVGVLEEEKRKPQVLIANVVAFLDLDKAAKSNDVCDTIDYRRIVQVVEQTAARSHWPLLESLSEAIANAVKALGAKRVCVQLVKPDSLKNGVPSVTIKR